MNVRKATLTIIATLLFTMLATGCVFGPKEDVGSDPIDPPQINYLEGEEEIVFEVEEGVENIRATNTEDEEANTTVERTLYLFDHQGYVVPYTFELPLSKSAAKQALEFLVDGGPVTSMLPSGMRAVLPAETEMTVDIKEDGTAVIDFSPEFTEYNEEDEKGILEAITWTLTAFDTIDQIEITINGHKHETMPVGGTPINSPLTRQDGINIEVSQGTNIGNSSVVTLYFMSQIPGTNEDYFVPVTRVIPRTDDLVMATLSELITGPLTDSGLVSDIIPTTEILHAEVNDALMTVDLDEKILQYSIEEPTASDDALTSIVLSITESELAEQVQFMVNGDTQVLTYNGADLSKPVSRPVRVNATGF